MEIIAGDIYSVETTYIVLSVNGIYSSVIEPARDKDTILKNHAWKISTCQS